MVLLAGAIGKYLSISTYLYLLNKIIIKSMKLALLKYLLVKSKTTASIHLTPPTHEDRKQFKVNAWEMQIDQYEQHPPISAQENLE